MTNLNIDFKKSVLSSSSLTSMEVVNNRIVGVLKPLYEGEKAQVKLVSKLAIEVANWIIFSMNNENTEDSLPTLDQGKNHLRDLIKTFVPQIENAKGELVADNTEVNKLNSHVSDAVKFALLICGANTGFIIGYRNETRQDLVETKNAFDKKGVLKHGLVQDVFNSPIKTFPKTMVKGKPVKNHEEHLLCTVREMRDSFGIHFEGKELNEDLTGIKVVANTRDKTEVGYVFTMPDGGLKWSGIKDAFQFMTSRLESGETDIFTIPENHNVKMKHCYDAIETFVKVYQTKKADSLQAEESAKESERLERLQKQELLKKRA